MILKPLGRPELPPTWPGLEKARKYQQISMKINDIEAPGPPGASTDLARARKSNEISAHINENQFSRGAGATLIGYKDVLLWGYAPGACAGPTRNVDPKQLFYAFRTMRRVCAGVCAAAQRHLSISTPSGNRYSTPSAVVCDAVV